MTRSSAEGSVVSSVVSLVVVVTSCVVLSGMVGRLVSTFCGVTMLHPQNIGVQRDNASTEEIILFLELIIIGSIFCVGYRLFHDYNPVIGDSCSLQWYNKP